jgi:D-3-phosphoglycerate dehydrogenase
MKKIVLTKKLNAEMQALFDGVDVSFVNIPEGDAEAFVKEMSDAEAVLLSTAFKVTGEIIEKSPKLKVISRTGVGVDNVDVASASKRGIMVLNTPAANSLSVAEHTLSLIGALSKQFFYYDSELRKGNFRVRRSNRCVDVEGKTLGLVGCGQIGRLVAKKCESAFNMKVIGYDPFIPNDIDNIKILKSLDDVLKQADYISLHLPLNDQTRNLINAEKLALLKPTAFILNTSRGGIIDEKALAEALKAGKLAGAGIDVFSEEPPSPDNPLLSAPNTILTPHSAALTKECTIRVAFEAIKGIADYCKGIQPAYIFNRKDLSL